MSKKVVVTGWDGYIGTSLVQRLLALGHHVIGIDNGSRRYSVEDRGSKSATPHLSMVDKAQAFSQLGKFEHHKLCIVENDYEVEKIFQQGDIDTVVNLAHQPSAPFSQIDRSHANFSLANNILGTNNLLWWIKQYNTSVHIINLGTAGEYDHYSGQAIPEGYFTLGDKEMIYPRRPGSIYHTSKVASTYLIDFLARTWNLRCTDIMQGVVFGCYTRESDQTGIFSRMDSDEAFGTAINRFTVQAMMGVPLTVYGEGKHKRSFLSLEDSIQALTIAINNPADAGRARVWNQMSEWHSMNDLALMVQEVAKENDMDVDISHIPTPRSEHTGDHFYHFDTDILTSLGYRPTRSIKEEVKYCFTKIDRSTFDTLREVVLPKITWR